MVVSEGVEVNEPFVHCGPEGLQLLKKGNRAWKQIESEPNGTEQYHFSILYFKVGR